jgi:hypothetical protein
MAQLKTIQISGWLADVNKNIQDIEGSIAQLMAAPVAPATTVEITAKSGIVHVPDDGATEAGPLALTLCDPVAGDDDGKILTIVTIAAEEQTVTLYSLDEAGEADDSAGFNGDATKNLATFDGGAGDVAIGQNMVLLAYNGVWYVLKTDATLGTAS